MDSRWLTGVKDKEQQKKKVATYKPAFAALTEVLEKQLKKKDACRDYNSPNWAYEQISVNEYNQALADVLKLINLKD